MSRLTELTAPRCRILMVGIAICLSCVPATSAQANQWVLGDVEVLDDYGSYDPALGILLTLANPVWGGGSTSNGASVCTNRIRLAVGQQGITDALQQRMYATLLSAHLTQRKAQLYVETVGPYCSIQIVTLGSGIR
jgi:hypothetical protein